MLLSSFSTAALAAEVHGVKLPDSIAVGGRPLKLNGIGVRSKTFLSIKVYVAGLYLETASTDRDRIIASDSVRRLVLRMTHDASKDKLIDELREGLNRNSKDELPVLKKRLDRFLRGVPDLKEGQTLTITYLPGRGTSIHGASGSEITVPGKDFADAILRVWLGTDPLDDDLKKRLLGAK
jgi:hypothetical protein